MSMHIDIDSSLMQNHVAGQALPAQASLAALCAADQSPILLALDEAGALTVSLRSPAQTNGWAQIGLTAQLAGLDGLGAAPVVQCFTAAQNVDGTLWVVLAAADAAGAGSKIFLSRALPNTGQAGDWEAFAEAIIPRSDGLPAGLVFSELILGNGDDQLGAPHIVGVGMLGGKMLHYLINPDPSDQSWTCTQVILPQNATACLAVAAGNIPDLGRGVYALCALETQVSLTFTTLPFIDADGDANTMSRQLALPAGYSPTTVAALAALPVQDGLTELYLSGAGLHRYPVSAQSKPVQQPLQIADATSFTGTSQLLANCCCASADAPPCIDVWALNNADLLVATTGTLDGSGTDYNWQLPLKLGNEITALTAYRASGENGGQGQAAVALGRSDGTLALMAKDPSASLWSTQTVSTPVHDSAVVLSTYTTRIVATDEDGMPLNGQSVLLQPSVDAPVLVNGQYVALKAAVAKPVTCDANGVLTVVLETTDLTAPVYTVSIPDGAAASGTATHSAAGLSQSADPAQLVKDQLRGIKDGSQISTATRSDGSPLFPVVDGTVEESCKQAAGGIEQLMGIYDQPGAFARTGSGDRAEAGRVIPRSARFEPCGGRRVGGGFRAVRGEAELAVLHPQGIVELVQSAGDLLYSALQDLLDVDSWSIDYLIGVGYQFSINLGTRILGFVIEVAEQAVSAIDFILKATLGFGFGDLIDWLGCFFHWDSILRTHRVIAHMTELAFDEAVSVIQGIELGVTELFSTARDAMVGEHVLVDQSDAFFNDRARQVPADQDQGARSPEANWGYQQLTGNLAGATLGALGLDMSDDLFSEISEDEIEIIQNAIGQAAPVILDGFATFDYAQVLDTLLDVFVTLVLDTAESVTLAVLRATASIIGYVKQMATERWDIPVLTWVYETVVCANDGSELTMLDALSLIMAVGSTVIVRGVTHEDPFPPDTVNAILATKTWDEMIALLSGDTAAAARTGITGSGTTDPGVALKNASVVLGLACVPRAFSCALFVVKAIANQANAAGLAKAILFLDWLCWGASVANTNLVLNARPAQNDLPRVKIDTAIVYYGLCPLLKDSFLVGYGWANGAAAAEAFEVPLAVAETGYGMAKLIAASVSFSEEVKEAQPEGADPGRWRQLINLKFTELFMSGLSGSFAFSDALPPSPVKAGFVAVRALFQVVELGGAIGLGVTALGSSQSDTGA